MMSVATETSPHTFTTGGPSSLINPTTAMNPDSEAPQEQRTHTSGSDSPHTLTSEEPSLIMSVASEPPQVVQMSLSDRGQHLPFLKFPRELRDKIYRYLLVWRFPLKSMQPEKYGYQARKRYEAEVEEEEEVEDDDEQKYEEVRNADFGSADKEGILCVNKQIRHEARDIFLKDNEFIYEEHIVSYDLNPNGIGRIERPRHKFEYKIKLPGIFKQAREVRASFSPLGNTLV